DKDWESREGHMEIDHLSRGFAALANVAEVRSLTQPLGAPLPDLRPNPDGCGLVHRLLEYLAPYLREFREAMYQKARGHYLSSYQEESAPQENAGAEAAAFHQPEQPPAEAPKKFVTRLDIVLKSDPFDGASLA